MTYLILKYLHILGAVVLLGTGTGIAFFMLAAHRTRNAAHIALTAATVVRADVIFTATAVLVQPVTGALLVARVGYDWGMPWIAGALALYAVVGAFWLPVVWMQVRLRNLAAAAAEAGEPLPRPYHRLFRLWFAFGIPGFGGTAAILWLMIAKPAALP